MRSHIRSAIGRLLSEISWEGNATPYRNGGQFKENVLTTEVFQALDFLPRKHFMAEVLKNAHDASSDLLGLFAKEAEEAEFSFLPGEIHVSHLTEKNVDVQPQ